MTIPLQLLIIGLVYLAFSYFLLVVILFLGYYFNKFQLDSKFGKGFLKVFPYLLIFIVLVDALVLWYILF